MPIPESVKVTFKGTLKDHMDFRDVVHATQAQMLDHFEGDNVFQGRIIEVHIVRSYQTRPLHSPTGRRR